MKNVMVLMLVVLASVALADGSNDTCESAAYLIDQGFTSFDVDLCMYENDYEGCGEMAAAGPDAVYRALVGAGEEMRLLATPVAGDFEVSMYIVTDCGDTVGSCVASSDGDMTQQYLDYTAEVGTLYFLIIDSVQGCGTVNVEMGGVLATEARSWSSVKALY